MGVPNEKLRVITEDVGGAFGMKTPIYPEYPALLVAASKLGRPVHWQSTRSEAFVTDTQARDTLTHAELALDEKGKFLAAAHAPFVQPGRLCLAPPASTSTPTISRAACPACTASRRSDVSVACYFSNTVPIGPYRGAGRPEANYALERVVEEAARITGMDPLRLRKKNLIPPSAMPYKTPINTYDSGDFPGHRRQGAEQLADYDNFTKRKREAAKRKKLRGIGISCMLEHAGAMPMEEASITFPGGDKMVLGFNVQSTGQSHATVFPRVLAEQARHRAGEDPAPARRHRTRADRLCLGRLALGDVRRQRPSCTPPT